MITGCIFDMDGVLLDSMAMWNQVAELYLYSRKIQPGENLNQELKALSLEEGALYLKKEYEIPDSVSEILTQFDRIILNEYAKKISAKEGVRELLFWLKDQKIPAIVATSTNRPLAVAAFNRLGISDLFMDVITDAQVGRSKRFPDIYLKAAELIHSKPETTWVFEDSIHAIKTAKGAGFRIAAVYDFYSEEDQAEILTLSDVYLIKLSDFIRIAQNQKEESDENSFIHSGE